MTETNDPKTFEEAFNAQFKFKVGDVVRSRVSAARERSFQQTFPCVVLTRYIDQCPGSGLQRHYTVSFIDGRRAAMMEVELEAVPEPEPDSKA